jgi:phosphoribosyl 1,2-cyclic phosphate phosphodiesterase
MKVTVLGCGGSGGVPLITGDWGRCNPSNSRNRRRRVSILVEIGEIVLLIDTSPDLRLQLLDAGVRRLDAVFYTHDHADHCHGIDELRSFIHGRKAPIDAYGSPQTLTALRRRFGYIFQQDATAVGSLYRPVLRPVPFSGPFDVGGVKVTPFEQDHGLGTVSTGFRIGAMAYSTDLVGVPPASQDALKNLELWIVDCLRFEPHPTHSHFEQTMAWVRLYRPRHAVLTHLNHMLDYDELRVRCPAGVEPGFDGMVVELPDP